MRGFVVFRNRHGQTCRYRGFTLIELLVTISVAGILLVVAVPAFREMILGNRLMSLTHETARAINLARSEAIKRGLRVSMCPSADGTNCANDGRWEQGWILFADPNTNGDFDAGDTLLRVHEAYGARTTVRTGSRFNLFLSYLPSGQSQGTGGSNDTFRLCNERGAALGFSITINNVGRVRIDRGANSCP